MNYSIDGNYFRCQTPTDPAYTGWDWCYSYFPINLIIKLTTTILLVMFSSFCTMFTEEENTNDFYLIHKYVVYHSFRGFLRWQVPVVLSQHYSDWNKEQFIGNYFQRWIKTPLVLWWVFPAGWCTKEHRTTLWLTDCC